MVLNLPADLYHPRAVASVSGLSGTGAGLCTLAATFATGVVSDRHSFGPIMVVASLVPLLAVVAVLTLVRRTDGGADDVLRRI
jgi:ACS family hexuronate transporter-like MFS transporter